MTPLTPHKSAPIRIIHIINDLEIGGAEVMLANLLSCIDNGAFDTMLRFLSCA